MNVVSRIGEFTDYAGNVRKFVMAAVSINEYGRIIGTSNYAEFERKVSLGISVCRPNDKFDEELGLRIAIGKATKHSDNVLYLSRAGFAQNKLVEAWIDQEMEYFKKDPGYFLAGYDKDADKYFRNHLIKEYKEHLSDDERKVFNTLKNAAPETLERMIDILCLEE